MINTFKINPSTYNCSSKEFRYSRDSNDEIITYTHRFPVYKYKNTCTLEAELTIIKEDGEVIIDVYDMNGRLYTPFYGINDNGFEALVEEINQKIINELKRLGLKNND